MRSSRAAFWSIACACGLVLRAASAAGQVAPLPEPWPQAAPPPTAAEPTVGRWYGWQTLLADTGVLTLAIGLGGRVDERETAAVIGAVVAGLGAFAAACWSSSRTRRSSPASRSPRPRAARRPSPSRRCAVGADWP
ncbi:MAG TPA: hypothetical protein VIF57_06745 [Polyangia bacterium]